MSADHPRIVIAGGGLAGLSLALALKQALGEGVEAVMYDPALKRDPHGDKRAYAIAAAGRRMLEALGIWNGIAWIWASGHYERPPQVGTVWVPPAQIAVSGTLVIRPGRWVQVEITPTPQR